MRVRKKLGKKSKFLGTFLTNIHWDRGWVDCGFMGNTCWEVWGDCGFNMKGGRQPGLLCHLATFDLFFSWFPSFHDEPSILTDVAIWSRKYYPDWDTKLQCQP